MSDRDSEVQSLFEVADDSLIGILGYHFYTMSMKYSVSEQQIWGCLPKGELPITFGWDRFYSKEELTAEMGCFYEGFHSRITLVFITSTFEAFLSDLIAILNKKGHHQKLDNTPKNSKQELTDEKIPARKLIMWAYQEASKYENKDAQDMINRLPDTFGLIDDARRLRNIIVHRKGLFDETYEEDAIDENGIKIHLHPHYKMFKKNTDLKVPVCLNKDSIILYNKAHIEALHILHNSIQQRVFGSQDAYSYKDEKKPIDWVRILRGT